MRYSEVCMFTIISITIKVVVAANVSVDVICFLNMLGNIGLNVSTTNNHPALTSYFVNPSFKQTNGLFGNPPDFLEKLAIFP